MTRHYHCFLIRGVQNIVALILFILILCRCSPKEDISNKIIKIDIQEKVSQHLPQVTIEKLSPLETNDSTLFGDISSIEFILNRIYLLDIFNTKSLLVFSKDGHYINRTKFGRGPGEMINPFAFYVDKNNQKVFVWDQTNRTMFEFDPDLNYLSEKTYTIHITNFSILNTNEILVQSHFNDFSYKLYTNDCDSIIGQFIQEYPYSGVYGLLRPISNNKRVLLISPLDYNVYQLTDREIHSEYFFDFGKFQLTSNEIGDNSVEDNFKLFNSGQRVSSLYEIAESEKFLLFHVYFNKQTIFYAYSLDTGNTIRLNDYFDKGILPVCNIRGIIENNVFYALVEPSEMIKFQKRDDPSISANDIQNPILITFKISSEF